MVDVSKIPSEELHAIVRRGRTAPEAPPMGWGDVGRQAVDNLGSSAYRFAENTIQPFLHPIDTAQNLYDLGKGLVAKTGAIDDPEAEAKADAVGRFFVDRYGSMENFKKTMAEDPVGVLADASMVITGGTSIAARAPGVLGKVAGVVNKVGHALDPLEAVATVGRGLSYPVGVLTGTGPRALQEAAGAGQKGGQAGQVLRRHMRGQGDITEPVEMARRGVATLKDRRSAEYKKGMVGVKANQGPIDMKPIYNAYMKQLNEYSPNGFAKSENAIAALKLVEKKLKEFARQPKTPEAVDWLKQSIGDIVDRIPREHTKAVAAATAMYNAVRDEIVKQVPEYAKVMGDYSTASDDLRQITGTFSLGDKALKDTSLRKLQSMTRNNVNTNYGARTKLGDQLGALEPDLAPAIAGQALNNWTPRGLMGPLVGAGGLVAVGQALMDPANLAALPLASPRLMGEVAHAGGRAYGVAKPVIKGAGVSQQAGRLASDMIPMASGASATPASVQDMTTEELLQIIQRGR